MSKLGIIHYNAPGKTLSEFLEWAADAGFGYVELMPPDVTVDGPDDADVFAQASAVRTLVRSYGLRVSAFSARNDFLVNDAALIARQIERMRKIATVTRILDEEAVIRSEGGWEKESVAQTAWEDTLYECFARCRDFLEKQGVDLAVDNHGTVTNEGDLLISLLSRLDSPRIGSNLDTMNFRWLGHDSETCKRFYAALAPRVMHVHLKDGAGSRSGYRGCALGEGEVALDYAVDRLRQAGYDGVYAAEYEGQELENGAGYAKCLAWMKARL